ncbi:MAG: hemerythrin domain-containing protein [Acidobacteriota bacterium]|nr:MAG: hemerythrin domain-containing protein [Acidobacteriota bacterium]
MRPQDNPDFKTTLPAGHVLHTMMSEHEIILDVLDKLEAFAEDVGKAEGAAVPENTRETLAHLAGHLIGAEPHHQREEEALFTELERRMIQGPTRVMRAEHQELRKLKHELEALAKESGGMELSEFKNRLAEPARVLVEMLRAHIHKENHVLYPMALRAIPEADTWKRLKEACDKIGYCCFTPEA